ncbi:hypothetical protein ACWFMI_10985 [Nocardiopsis terrae]
MCVPLLSRGLTAQDGKAAISMVLAQVDREVGRGTDVAGVGGERTRPQRLTGPAQDVAAEAGDHRAHPSGP